MRCRLNTILSNYKEVEHRKRLHSARLQAAEEDMDVDDEEHQPRMKFRRTAFSGGTNEEDLEFQWTIQGLFDGISLMPSNLQELIFAEMLELLYEYGFPVEHFGVPQSADYDADCYDGEGAGCTEEVRIAFALVRMFPGKAYLIPPPGTKREAGADVEPWNDATDRATTLVHVHKVIEDVNHLNRLHLANDTTIKDLATKVTKHIRKDAKQEKAKAFVDASGMPDDVDPEDMPLKAITQHSELYQMWQTKETANEMLSRGPNPKAPLANLVKGFNTKGDTFSRYLHGLLELKRQQPSMSLAYLLHEHTAEAGNRATLFGKKFDTSPPVDDIIMPPSQKDISDAAQREHLRTLLREFEQRDTADVVVANSRISLAAVRVEHFYIQ